MIDGSALPNDVLFDLRQLRPVLLNRYSRKYYQSADKRYRITLDTDVSFFHFLGSFRGHAVTSIVPGTTILELKYSMADDDTVPMMSLSLEGQQEFKICNWRGTVIRIVKRRAPIGRYDLIANRAPSDASRVKPLLAPHSE